MVMTRGTPTALLSAFASGRFYPVAFVYLDWPEGEIRWHTSRGTITWGGNDWLGVGAFGNLALPEEALSLVPAEAALRLYGVPDDIYDYLDDPIRNRPGAIYVGALTTRAGSTLVADPVEIFAGYMDAFGMKETVEVSEGRTELRRFAELQLGSGPGARVRGRISHSAEDQVAKFPGDTAGRPLIHNRANAEKLTWPSS